MFLRNMLFFIVLFLFFFNFCDRSQAKGAFGDVTRQRLLEWSKDEMDHATGNTNGKLTDAQLEWGEKEIESMLQDRPEMSQYLKKGDDLWNWTVREFAGEKTNIKVKWENQIPNESGKKITVSDAEFISPTPEDPYSHICVTEKYTGTGTLNKRKDLVGKLKSPDILWMNVIFELINSEKAVRDIKVCRRALLKEIDRETFILEMDMMEQQTRQECYDFYSRVWIPHCEKMKIKPSRYYLDEVLKGGKWKVPLVEDRINDLVTKKEMFSKYKYLGFVYDSIIFPYLN